MGRFFGKTNLGEKGAPNCAYTEEGGSIKKRVRK